MEYIYKLKSDKGASIFSIQKAKFSTQEILVAYNSDKTSIHKWVKCDYIGELKKGYALCGCGTIFKGVKGQLCPDCVESYGHHWEWEL